MNCEQLEFRFFKDYPHILEMEKFEVFIAPYIKNLCRNTFINPFEFLKGYECEFNNSLSIPIVWKLDPSEQYLFRFLEEVDKNGICGIEIDHLFLDDKSV